MTLTALFIIAHIISFLLMGVFIYEYIHIHSKRVVLMEALYAPSVRLEIFQRMIFIAIYIGTTLIITVVSSILFFLRPDIL